MLGYYAALSNIYQCNASFFPNKRGKLVTNETFLQCNKYSREQKRLCFRIYISYIYIRRPSPPRHLSFIHTFHPPFTSRGRIATWKYIYVRVILQTIRAKQTLFTFIKRYRNALKSASFESIRIYVTVVLVHTLFMTAPAVLSTQHYLDWPT